MMTLPTKIILNNNEIASSNEEKILGILLGSKLNFDPHITSFCKKAGQKRSALARINHCLTQDENLLLLNSVVKSQFSYFPQIWMLTSRYLNNALNSIHERALHFICNNYELPFDRVLEDNKQKIIHQKNIESLAIEIFKFQAGLTTPIMGDLFVTGEKNYSLRNFLRIRIFTQTNSNIWDRNYFLQGTSNMEPDSGKIKDIRNIR